MSTLTHRRARGTNPSRRRRGFVNPDSARKIAAAFLDAGYTAAGLREETVPGDQLLAELADAMDEVTELDVQHATLVTRLPAQRTVPDGAPDAA